MAKMGTGRPAPSFEPRIPFRVAKKTERPCLNHMPTYNFICESCGTPGRAWRPKGFPPRFCGVPCRNRGLVNTRKKVRWPITPDMHEEIRSLYQSVVGMSSKAHPVRAYAERIGYPRWKITRYAIRQGWIACQKKEPDWSDKELEVLEQSAHRSPEVIQRRLKRCSFSRTVTGIVLKRRRMRFLKNKNGYSAREVAEAFGIDSHTVSRWIRCGGLKAKKRQTRRTPQQGGDIYYIKDKWIKDFILKHLPEIDLRKVDKYWFVDLLMSKGE